MMIIVRHLDDSVDVEATNEHCHLCAAHIPDDFCDPQLSYIPDDQKRRPLVLIGGSMCSSSQSSAPVRPSFKIQSNVLPNILSLYLGVGVQLYNLQSTFIVLKKSSHRENCKMDWDNSVVLP